MILHTLNASPTSAAFEDCLRILVPGDALVLMGDGVYGAIEDTTACTRLTQTGAELYLLRADATAAGIIQLAVNVSPLDMDGLVALTERFPRQQAWY